MSVEVRVPTTGNAGEDAVILEIRVHEGDDVREGDTVAVLETAKASVDVVAPADGTVLLVAGSEGDEVAEHSVLVVLGKPGEAIDEYSQVDGADEIPAVENPTEREASPPRIVSTAANNRVAASPRARVMAERRGIDLNRVTGTGPAGRIIVPDVIQLTRENDSASDEEVTPSSSRGMGDEYREVPVKGARKITAQRMVQSLADSAQVTLNLYAPADTLVSFQRRLRAHHDDHGGPKLGLNDLVNYAVATTLTSHPAANSHFSWEGIKQYRDVHLGVAVDTSAALQVPVVKRANHLSLVQLAEYTRTLIERARHGGLSAEEMEGGTFTVTNLGMFGVHWFTPVLNSPQSCILGVGAIHQPTPDSPALLPLSLTFDHRALDGADAARALAAISAAIESIDVLSALAPSARKV